MSETNIIRKGTWPILKYTVRVWGFHTIMIDDTFGDLLVSSDQGSFKHWWGEVGRGTKTLREFLVDTSPSYIEDKLSYGLDHWDSEEADRGLKVMCTEKWGHPDKWPYEVAEAVESNDFNSWGEMYHGMFGVTEFAEAFEPPDLPGNASANPGVRRFVKNVWPELVDFWKAELQAEKGMEKAMQNMEYP